MAVTSALEAELSSRTKEASTIRFIAPVLLYVVLEDTPDFRILRASGFFSRSKPETLKSRRPQREDWGIRGRKGRQGEEPSDKNAKFLIETTVD